MLNVVTRFSVLKYLRRIQPVWVLVLGAALFFSFGSPDFLTVFNLNSILLESSTIGFIAIGMTFVIINGNIDLSVGSLLALTAVVSVGFQTYGLIIAIGAALLVGATIGLLNGLIIVTTGITSFIVTLAAMIGIKGLVFAFTKEQSLTALDPNFTNLGTLSLGPIPAIALFYLGLTAFGAWLLSDTVHGLNAIAVGGNPEAARNSGIKVGRHIIINYVIIGLLSSIAGITLAMQMGSATPVLGTNYELWTITAVVLGGTSLKGGAGSVIGTFGGTLLIGILLNGMNLLNVAPFYVYLVLGCVLIGALLVDKNVSRTTRKYTDTLLHRARLYEQTAERIKHQITSGVFRRGDQLPNERELAVQLGVSRTVVGEAIKTLVQNGLVEVHVGDGTFVVDGTSDALKRSLKIMMSFETSRRLSEMVEVREMLEPEIAARAALNATPHDIAELRAAIDTMDKNLDAVWPFIAADNKFHLTLAIATRNELIPRILESVVDLLNELRSHIFRVKGGTLRGQRHHKEILQAIVNRDPVAAREAMAKHLQQVRQDTERSLLEQKGREK